MFPKFLTSLEKRTELTKITLIKMTLSPIIVKTILSLIEQNPNIIEIVLVDCQIRSSIIGDSSNLDFFLE